MKGKSSSKTNSKGKSKASSSKKAGDLRKLFEDELKDIYWAEKALTKALTKLSKKASSDELKEALEEHQTETEEHVKKCEQVFELLDKAARGKKCEAMEGLISEADEIVSSTEEGVVRDAGIISACQKVEHYEIASYGTLVSFAKTLGEDEAADILAEILSEEKKADEKLTDIAESSINEEALAD